MHQLRALIWKAYKVRLRTPVTTLLDVAGPILVMLGYLCLKLVLGAVPLVPDPSVASASLFRQTQVKLLDPKLDLQQHLCTKVLFHAVASGRRQQQQQESIRGSLPGVCGIQLIDMPSRQELINKLESTLRRRIEFKQNDLNLNKPNLSQLVAGCFTLPGEREPCYQAGIVVGSDPLSGVVSGFEIYMTDTAQNPVVYQPYTQGSSYNEFRLPHSDLNSGLHLLELCLANTLDYLRHLGTGGGGSGHSFAPSPFEEGQFEKTQGKSSEMPASGLKLRIRASPVIAAPVVVPTLFIVFLLLAHLFNALAATMRACEENESGLHHYIRTSGVPAGIYWLGQLPIVLIHMAVQSLIIAVVLAIPTSDHLFDPIYEANITMRYLLILTYGTAITTHSMFIGSLLSKSSHSVLVFCVLALIYCMFPIAFLLQWNAYGFVGINKFIEFIILNPVSNYMILLMVIIAVSTQTAEPPNWGQIHMRIIGGGVSDWSIGSLWALLVAQAIVWFLLLIVVDQIQFCSSRGPINLIFEITNELFFCNRLGPKLEIANNDDDLQRDASKSSSAGPMKSAPSRKDPNRICCSVKHISVEGPTLMLAHTKGDPLKVGSMKPSEKRQQHAPTIKQQHQEEGHHNSSPSERVSKTHQFLIDRSRRPSSAGTGSNALSQQQQAGNIGAATELEGEPVATAATSNSSNQNQHHQPIYLDETIQQHIVWYDTKLSFENLSLDFRYNQMSFILGQTDLKDLFFASLLGLRSLDSGYIVLDGAKFKPNNISLARPYIGYLGERDILNQEMSIFENLQFFGSLRDPSYTHFDSESQFVLSMLHLSSRKDNLPQLLTSRSARKLALAVAAVGHTKLLLLVEPTLNLRWKPRCQVLNLLKKYKAIRSIVVDTSDIDEAIAFGDRVVLLRNGRADLDGSPERLSRKLCCGYWLVFEPIPSTTDHQQNKTHSIIIAGGKSSEGGKGGAPQPSAIDENIKALEALTSGLFKQDKLDRLDSTKRSVYQELMLSSGADLNDNDNIKQTRPRHLPAESPAPPPTTGGGGGGSVQATSKQAGATDTAAIKRTAGSKPPLSHDRLHKTTVIAKVQYSKHSNQALCSALKMFSPGKQLHGYRLAEITFESLEDVMVLRISKAMYPDLPPDLLLSLQHRTMQATFRGSAAERTQSQVSVRKFTSDLRVPKVSRPMFGARMIAILTDRITMVREMTIMGIVFLLALLVITAHLWALRALLEPELSTLTEAHWLSQSGQRTSKQKRNQTEQQWQLQPKEPPAPLELAAPATGSTTELLNLPPTTRAIQEKNKTLQSQPPLPTQPAFTATTKCDSSNRPTEAGSTTAATNGASFGDGASDGGDLGHANGDANHYYPPGNNESGDDNADYVDDDASPLPRPPSTTDERVAIASVKEISLIEKLYENRMAFYVIVSGASRRRQSAPTPKPADMTSDVGEKVADNLDAYFEHWSGNKRLTGTIARSLNESDAIFVTNLIQKSKDLLVSIIVLDPESGEATIVFEPHLAHAMIASIQTYINYYFTFEPKTLRQPLFTATPDLSESPQLLIQPAGKVPSNDLWSSNNEHGDSNKSISAMIEHSALPPSQIDHDANGHDKSYKRKPPFQLRVLQHNFQQSWHEMLRGHLDRRFFYGLGFTIAEGLAIGVLVMAPIRHRSESKVNRVPTTYWLAMGLFDMALSLILVIAYTIIIIAFERTSSTSVIFCIIFTLTLYKFASIPFAYLISLLVQTAMGGFLFVFLITFAIGWVFGIHIKSFIEWTLSGSGYIYTVSSWVIHFFPISSLIEAMSNINQMNRINELCSQVPAYTSTSSPVKPDGYNNPHLVDRLLVVVRDCLANGKTRVSMSLFDREAPFSIIWIITLTILFALVTWTFLFFSERVFGVFARRFTSTKSSKNPMKTIIRPSTDSVASSFDWDKEKDRLVSEYIRCINESRYVKQMVTNCYYLRIWLRPFSDQSSMDKRLAFILEPLISLGQPKNELQVELKTTLQLFVRIGNESSRHKLDRIQIIETYSKFVDEHSDMVAKFALVDWTREALYKILLHGYYNTKSKTPLL